MRVFSRSLIIAAAFLAVMPIVPAAQSTGAPPTADDFFNRDTIQRVELWVNSADWEKLKENFRENDYYQADVIWNGIKVRSVGIRSRGLGSRSGTKPGIRVDIDHYVSKQTFLGLKSFILDNLVQDKSTIHETTAMQFFAKMDIPAPREAHARLFVNGRYAGLYAVVESVDKSFLARVFGEIDGDTQNDGYLFEYDFVEPWRFNYLGRSLEPYKLRFDIKTHEDKSDETIWRPIEEIVRLANELPSDRYMEQLDAKLDLRQMVRFAAVQNFVSENDGLLGYDGMNNYYFYRKENSDQHVFIAWDDDNAFAFSDFAVDTRHDENVLFRKAMEVPELRDLYYATLNEAARVAETPAEGAAATAPGWLESEIRRRLDMVWDPLAEDPNKPYTMDEHETSRNQMIQFSMQRIRYVQANARGR
jgi:spore coat protein H